MSHLKISILTFSTNFCSIKLTCLVTLFDRTGCHKTLQNQNVHVTRFARNVECDFFCDFQTPWAHTHFHEKSAFFSLNFDKNGVFLTLYPRCFLPFNHPLRLVLSPAPLRPFHCSFASCFSTLSKSLVKEPRTEKCENDVQS